MPKIICEHCGTEFYRKPSRIARNDRQYCSAKCYGLARRKNESRTCPVCEKQFIVKPSAAKVHCSPECASIALQKRCTISCEWCGKEFEKKQCESAMFCSRDCYFAWKTDKSWEHRTCPVCRKKFKQRVSQKQICCSQECAGIHKRTRFAAQCEICGKQFDIVPSMQERGFGRFCSWLCYNEWQRTRTGELAANWRGGRTPQIYPKKFNARFRRRIRKRDEYTCAVCRLRGSDVHHINYIKKDTFPENCITLCKSCHATTNVNREYWSDQLVGIMAARGYIDAYV